MKQFVHTSHHKELVNTLPYIGVGVLLLAIVLLLEKVGLIATEPFYVGMHTSVELFSVVISFLIFAIGWNTWHFTRNSKLLLLSCLMLCVAIFDALHFLSFSSVSDHEKNMEQVFAFWLFARFFNAAAFLVIATAIWVNYKLFNARVVLSTLLSVTACIVAVVFYFPDWLPTLYIEGVAAVNKVADRNNTDYALQPCCVYVCIAIKKTKKHSKYRRENACLFVGDIK